MPGSGLLKERDYTPAELTELLEGAAAEGLMQDAVLGCLGLRTLDVYLNGVAYWRNIPSQV